MTPVVFRIKYVKIYLANGINIMFQEKWSIGWESSEREWVVADMRCRQLGLEVVQNTDHSVSRYSVRLEGV